MADFDVRKDKQEEWYWTFQADNSKTIARSSESYKNRADCLHAIKIVKDNAKDCKVWDLTTSPPTQVTSLP